MSWKAGVARSTAPTSISNYVTLHAGEGYVTRWVVFFSPVVNWGVGGQLSIQGTQGIFPYLRNRISRPASLTSSTSLVKRIPMSIRVEVRGIRFT